MVVPKGSFVAISKDGKSLIARIDEVTRNNRYFEKPSTVAEYSRNGSSVSRLFPTERWEYLIANAHILGTYDEEGMIGRSRHPPSPGDTVSFCGRDVISGFLGLDDGSGLEIGRLEHQDLPARLDMTSLFQKHLAILAMSGAGKSYLSTVMFEELMDRKEEDGQLAVVVLDPHGEYSRLSDDKRYMRNVKVVKGSDFMISVHDYTSSNFSAFIEGLSPAQEIALDSCLESLRKEYKDNGSFGLKEVISRISQDEGLRASTRDPLVSRLRSLDSMRLFGKHDYPSLKEIAPGRLVIVDMSDLQSQRKRQIIASSFASRLFWNRQKEKIPPFLLVVEEAHNFAPESTKKHNAISKRIIEKIAREGRKFYASLCLISQRPVHLSTTALSQCNTHIIMRVTNPYDLDHIRKTSEGLTQDVINTISSLRTGEAVIVGEAVRYPAFIHVRQRRSNPPSHSRGLKESAIEYSRMRKQNDDDMDAFL